MRFIKYLFGIIIFLVVVIYFVFTTSYGMRFTISVVNKFIPGQLQIARVQGNLISGLFLENITYSDESIQASAKFIRFSWDLAHVWHKKIIIKNLASDDIKINYIANASSKQGSSNFLPFGMTLDVEKIKIKNFIFLKNNEIKIKIDEFSTIQNANQTYSIFIKTLNGIISGNLAFDHSNYFSWNIGLKGERLNPGVITKNLNGEINFLLSSDGKWIEKNKQFNLTLYRVHGKISDFPLNGTSIIRFVNGNLEIKKSEFNIANAFARFSGHVANVWNINWHLSIPDLNVIIPNTKGEINCAGKIIGDYAKPRLETDLNAILPEVKKLKLHLLSAISLTDNFSVNADISDGEATINKLGINLQKISLNASYEQNKPIHFNGNFVSGKGTGTVLGSFDFHQKTYPFNLKLDGENLTVVKLAEYKIKASPHLTGTYSDQSISLQGDIVIPQAKIKPKDFSNVTTLPSEVVFVDDAPEQTHSYLPANISMNLKIVLGENILFSYENLQTQLKGKVNIFQRPGSLPVGTGELFAINGKYQAYGKSLKIKEGRIIYTGNLLTNPGLDVRAVQEIKTMDFNNQSQFTNNNELKSFSENKISVGVWIRGTLNNPVISLISEPAGLSNPDIISYLIFGYPQSKVKDASSLMILNNLASSINAGGKGGVKGTTKKIKKVLGLSELSIGSTEYFDASKNAIGSSTTFNISKKFGKKLSFHYKYGLFDSYSVFNIRYQINKRLAIQSETSSIENGADILYQIERD